MSEYKSPIKVTFEDISNEVIDRYDDAIICCVKKVTGIDVDKKRLINALKLDKKLVRCTDCKYWDYDVDNDVGFCVRTEDCDWNADDFCSKGERK